MFRGIAMELREHFSAELWHQFWDAAFCAVERALDRASSASRSATCCAACRSTRDGYFQGTFAFLAQSLRVARRRSLRSRRSRCTARRSRRCASTASRRSGARAAARTVVGGAGALRRRRAALTFAVRGAPGDVVAVRDAGRFAGRARRRCAGRGNGIARRAAFAASSAFIVVAARWQAAGRSIRICCRRFRPGAAAFRSSRRRRRQLALTCRADGNRSRGSCRARIYGSVVWRRMARQGSRRMTRR